MSHFTFSETRVRTRPFQTLKRSAAVLVCSILSMICATQVTAADLVVGEYYLNTIYHYDWENDIDLGILVPNGGGVNRPRGITYGYDGQLYVSSSGDRSIVRIDRETGDFLDTFVPSGTGGLVMPGTLLFGPDGYLYVSSAYPHNQVLRFDGFTGEFVDSLAPSNSSMLSNPSGLAFGPDGALYVISNRNHQVLRFDESCDASTDCQTWSVFVQSGAGGIVNPHSIAFDESGNLYLSEAWGQRVLRYDGTTGEFIDVFVDASQGANGIRHIEFGPDGFFYAASALTYEMVRFDSVTGERLDEILYDHQVNYFTFERIAQLETYDEPVDCDDSDPCTIDSQAADGSCLHTVAPEQLDPDADGLCGFDDLCPYDAENDIDGDGLCESDDVCPYDPENDADFDGVCGALDMCAGTFLPEDVPTRGLGVNRWADIDGDGQFDTVSPNGQGPGRSYSIEDTGGCSCEQIIEELHLGNGHRQFGCSIGVMDQWVDYASMLFNE